MGRSFLPAKLGAILVFIVTPIIMHILVVETYQPTIVLVISALQLLTLGVVLGSRNPGWVKGLVLAAAVLVISLASAHWAGLGLSLIPGIPHAVAYAALLAGFGGSLLPGQVPILTRVVVSVRGPLPAALLLHTRHVTAAWCCFFAAQLVISLALYVWAPLAVWSFFINVLNIPLILLMFIVEYSYRVLRFRGYPHDTFADMIRIVAKTAKTTGQTDPA